MSEANIAENSGGWARRWLFDHALPLWWERGYDHADGGFHDRLDLSGEPVDLPNQGTKRLESDSVSHTLGALGWDGPWQEAVRGGLAFLQNYRRADGIYRGYHATPDDKADLYDQAFVLFALAAAQRAFPGEGGYQAQAEDLLDRLTLYALPIGGFRETDGRAGLRSNPHMHLLEALLAWAELAPDSRMTDIAREILPLALAKMIDPRTGAIGEYFDDNWGFADGEPGLVREPGHQFEWAFLLGEAERTLGLANAAVADRLYDFGRRFGISQGKVLFSLAADGSPLDVSSRLWAQTEWLRAALLRGEADDAEAAFRTICAFLDVPTSGLWHERMETSGNWVDEAAPASSLYHLMTAFDTAIRCEPAASSVPKTAQLHKHS